VRGCLALAATDALETGSVVTSVVRKLADDGYNGQTKGPRSPPGPWSREVADYFAVALLIARTVAGAGPAAVREAPSRSAACFMSAGLTMW
jgi:hypothetical protein